MLEIRGLTCRYGPVTAVREVGLEVRAGEVVALLGSNGAGKSTLLRAISGVQRPSSGTIAFLGEDITRTASWTRVARGIAHAPEGRMVFGTLTVEENLRLGAANRSARDARVDVAAMYDKFPILGEKRSHLAASLSGGQQQFLALARALMARPKLLMLDEPSMGLAPLAVELVYRSLEGLKRAGTTMLLVEQNAQVALAVADRAYVLVAGEMAFDGTASELADDPRLTEAYLGG